MSDVQWLVVQSIHSGYNCLADFSEFANLVWPPASERPAEVVREDALVPNYSGVSNGYNRTCVIVCRVTVEKWGRFPEANDVRFGTTITLEDDQLPRLPISESHICECERKYKCDSPNQTAWWVVLLEFDTYRLQVARTIS